MLRYPKVSRLYRRRSLIVSDRHSFCHCRCRTRCCGRFLGYTNHQALWSQVHNPFSRLACVPIFANRLRSIYLHSRLPAVTIQRLLPICSFWNPISPGSEYIPGGKLIDQTLPEEMDEYRNLEGFFERMEFWDTLNACFEYRYQSRNEERYAIITSIQIEAVTCCLIENKLQP